MTTEMLIRVSAFVAVMGLMASWEVLAPRRRLTTPRLRRWVANLSVVVVDAAVIRPSVRGQRSRGGDVGSRAELGLAEPSGLADLARNDSGGRCIDFVLYLQHVVFHAVPLFWRFHMMHHADLDCDVTSWSPISSG